MESYRRFRTLSLLSNLVLYLAPIVLGLAALWLSREIFSINTDSAFVFGIISAAIAAVIISLIQHFRLQRGLELVYSHLSSISRNNFEYRTPIQLKGIFGNLISLLNRLTDTLQSFSSRTQSETSVMASEANRLRNVINSINDGVLALDKSGRIILFNKASGKITGFTIDEAAGQPVSRIAPFLRGNSLVLNDWLIANEGSDLKSQTWQNVRLKTKDGKIRAIDLQALYQGADPNGVRTLITFQDRTEAQELEDMKVDFVALAAHELRTPISVIKGYLEILDNEIGQTLSPEHQEFMRKLTVSASQLSGFINNILHVSRIEHGNLNLKREPLSWIEIVKKIIQETENKAKLQGKTLSVKLPNTAPQVAVDRLSIVEVLNNLIDNAIKYSEHGNEVIIKVTVNGDVIETTVTDHGVGIPENAIDKLFTKFYRSHRTRSSHRGTGLGLYMSKAIVEAHGGRVWVRSKIGQGSTFGFSLPVYNGSTGKNLAIESNNKIIRGVHGWIKNHSLYRG